MDILVAVSYTHLEYSYDGKEMSVMAAKMIWSDDTEPVSYTHLLIQMLLMTRSKQH